MSIEGMKLGVFDDFLMPLDLDSLISRIREAHQAKKEVVIDRPSQFQRCQNIRCQNIMVAASFAESGEAEMANLLLNKEPNWKEPKNVLKKTNYKKQKNENKKANERRLK
jgi:hypothetical protein